VAVALRHAHIDRKVGTARKRRDVIDGEVPAPVLLGQTIDADLPAEAATVEDDRVVGKRREIDLAGDDVGLELERAAPRFIEPDVDAGVACASPGRARSTAAAAARPCGREN
jgi:hypothetical protein